MLAKEEKLLRDIKVRGSLGRSDCEKVEFRSLRADVGLLRDLLGRILWHTAPERRG